MATLTRDELRKAFVRETKLSESPRGYRRAVGTNLAGGYEQFTLGKSLTEAEKRINQIVELWITNLQELGFDAPTKKTFKPYWQPAHLAAARQIAKGEAAAVGSRLASPDIYLDRIDALRSHGVAVVASDPLSERLAIRERRELLADLQEATKKRTGQTVAETIEAYEKAVRKEYTVGNQLTDTGETVVTKWKSLKNYLGDCSYDLAELDKTKIEEIYDIFRSRPQTKYKRPMSKKYVKDMIFEIRRWLKWLNFSDQYHWRFPFGYEIIPRKPKPHETDSIRKEATTYSHSELALIWESANALERCIMAFGLNGAFGADQLGRLRMDEISLERRTIDRIRHKKNVRQRWYLWDITKQAYEWYVARRPKPAADCDPQRLFVTDHGASYYKRTAGGKRAKTLPNKWRVLLNRVRKTNPEVPLYPFNSLRRTSVNFIRQMVGDELASLQAAHKTQTNDKNLDSYSKPRRKAHRKALRRFELRLTKRVFSKVAEPFPAAQANARSFKTGGGPTPITIRRIRQLRADGLKLAKIGEILDLDRNTVAKYCRPAEPK